MTRPWSTSPQGHRRSLQAAEYSQGGKHLRTEMNFQEGGREDTEKQRIRHGIQKLGGRTVLCAMLQGSPDLLQVTEASAGINAQKMPKSHLSPGNRLRTNRGTHLKQQESPGRGLVTAPSPSAGAGSPGEGMMPFPDMHGLGGQVLCLLTYKARTESRSEGRTPQRWREASSSPSFQEGSACWL